MKQELYILVAATLFGFIGLVTLIITNFLHMRSDKWLDLMDDTVYRVSGIAILSLARSTSNRVPFNAPPYQKSDVGLIYKLRINDQNFIINSEAFHALVNGSAYSVYYAEKSNPILSIEPLNNIDQSPLYVPNAKRQASYMDYPPQKKKHN